MTFDLGAYTGVKFGLPVLGWVAKEGLEVPEPQRAEVVAFLASPAADYITGQILFVDGGWMATF